jgi:hypothetical protein
MANWFPMATKEEPHWWLWKLPPESILSWRDLCECFLDKYAPLGPEPKGPQVLAALGGFVPRAQGVEAGGLGALSPRLQLGREGFSPREE